MLHSLARSFFDALKFSQTCIENGCAACFPGMPVRSACNHWQQSDR